MSLEMKGVILGTTTGFCVYVFCFFPEKYME